MKVNRMLKQATLALALPASLLVGVSPVSAAVIYDEGVSGDLTSDQTATTFSFGIGGNEIVGSGAQGDSGSDPDNFTFTLPGGTSLTSVQYSFDNVARSGNIRDTSVGYKIFHGISVVETTTAIDILVGTSAGTSPVNPFPGGIELPADTYSWRFSSAGWGGSVGVTDDVSWDYRLLFTVDSVGQGNVPIPATAALLGLGLLGLYGVAKRKGT